MQYFRTTWACCCTTTAQRWWWKSSLRLASVTRSTVSNDLPAEHISLEPAASSVLVRLPEDASLTPFSVSRGTGSVSRYRSVLGTEGVEYAEFGAGSLVLYGALLRSAVL